MDKEEAIDRILADLNYGEGLRFFVARLVDEWTGYAARIDQRTLRVLEDAVRKEVQR